MADSFNAARASRRALAAASIGSAAADGARFGPANQGRTSGGGVDRRAQAGGSVRGCTARIGAGRGGGLFTQPSLPARLVCFHPGRRCPSDLCQIEFAGFAKAAPVPILARRETFHRAPILGDVHVRQRVDRTRARRPARPAGCRGSTNARTFLSPSVASSSPPAQHSDRRATASRDFLPALRIRRCSMPLA